MNLQQWLADNTEKEKKLFLTEKQVRSVPGFENISDEEVINIINTLHQFSLVEIRSANICIVLKVNAVFIVVYEMVRNGNSVLSKQKCDYGRRRKSHALWQWCQDGVKPANDARQTVGVPFIRVLK